LDPLYSYFLSRSCGDTKETTEETTDIETETSDEEITE